MRQEFIVGIPFMVEGRNMFGERLDHKEFPFLVIEEGEVVYWGYGANPYR